MKVHVIVPAAVDDVDTLILRLKEFTGIIVRSEGNKIILRGDQDKLLCAQNYALRFIGPESVQHLRVSPECFSLLHVSGLVRHFEDTFDVIVCFKDPQVVLLKGRKRDIERFQTVLKALDSQCTIGSITLTLFKLSNLRLLCDKFNVAFDEVPSQPSLQMALLAYFSSLLDELSRNPSVEPQSISFLEVYRKRSAEPLVSHNRNMTNAGSTGPSVRPCIPVIGRKASRSSSKSVDRGKARPAESPTTSNNKLRTVVIDGSNVAFAHGKQKEFSPQGIQLALDFFLRRGHTNVVAVVPRHRQGKGGALFERLEHSGHLCYSPSRLLDDSRQVADDDRIILQLAVESDAVVISNDQFRNYRDENEQFKEVIDHRLLQYTLALDTFLVAEDPHGANKPGLSELLRATSVSRR